MTKVFYVKKKAITQAILKRIKGTLRNNVNVTS